MATGASEDADFPDGDPGLRVVPFLVVFINPRT
jgi:hypothetical protein